MRNKRRSKLNTKWIGNYVANWLLAGVMGFACWGIAHLFSKGYLFSANASLVNPRFGDFLFGILCGVCGLMCYFIIWQQLAPVVRWIWHKAKKDPKPFSKLVS